MHRIFFATLAFLFCIQSCTTGGDYTEELSGGYFFRSEGDGLHDILCHSSGQKDVPADVLSYDYDDNFIIAMQKPAAFEDPLYENTYEYPQGKDKIYCWLIIHRQEQVLRPLLESEFHLARKKYGVPKDLDAKKYPLNK